MQQSTALHVPETAFGKWFLKTETWRVHVLERAMADLVRLMPQRQASYPVVVDVGCGCGYSLPKLAQRFAPGERRLHVDTHLPHRLHIGDHPFARQRLVRLAHIACFRAIEGQRFVDWVVQAV